MECDKCKERLSHYMEGLLDPEETTLVRTHLDSCEECRGVYSELKKAVEHIRELEEVEPPRWMTRKIMARVKEEKEKKGIWRRLFYPLHVKLPIEAAATLIIAITAIYVFKAAEHDFKTSVLRPGEVVEKPLSMEDKARNDVAEPSKAGKESASDVTGGKTEPSAGQTEVHRASPADTPQNIFKEKPSIGAAQPARSLQQPVREKDLRGEGGAEFEKRGSMDTGDAKTRMEYFVRPKQEELKHKPSAAAPMEEMNKVAPKEAAVPSREINLTLGVRDIDDAMDEIRKVLSALDCRMILSDTDPDEAVLTVEVEHGKADELLEKLGSIGEWKENTPSLETMEKTVRIRINFKKMPIR
jgi:hypothetical protein